MCGSFKQGANKVNKTFIISEIGLNNMGNMELSIILLGRSGFCCILG